MQSPPSTSPSMQNLFTFLPFSPDLKPYQSLHRQRYLQLNVLEDEEMKARAEAFGERASSMFKNNVFDEILVNMKEDGQFVTGYTLAMLEEDFEIILKEVISVSQNVPTQNALESVLSQFPQAIQSRLKTIFHKHVDAFWVKAGSVFQRKDEGEGEEEEEEEEEDYEINLETGERKKNSRMKRQTKPKRTSTTSLSSQSVPSSSSSSPTLTTTSFSALSLSSDAPMNF